MLHRGGRGQEERPLQRWGIGPAGRAGGARRGSFLAAGSEREARAANICGPERSRRLWCGAMEELDGEPTVTVRAPPKVLFAFSGFVTAGLSTSRPPARRSVPFPQINCHRPEVTSRSCPSLGCGGRWVSAPLYIPSTWSWRPRSMPLTSRFELSRGTGAFLSPNRSRFPITVPGFCFSWPKVY